MGFNNHAQRSTPPYYLDVDNPFAALCPPLCSLATSQYAKKVWMLGDSTASVLSRTGPSCGSALKWALADWCCYGFCRLESRNQECFMRKSFTIWNHFWPLLFPKESQYLKSLDIELLEVGAKRCLNGVNKWKKKSVKKLFLLQQFLHPLWATVFF